MSKNPTPHEFEQDSPSDIALSTWEYHDFIDAVNDSRLSARSLMKFKELYRRNSVQMLVPPVVAFPLAWFCSKWAVGFVNRGLASSRFNLIGMALFYPLFLYWGYTIPIPRKLYTDLIADNGEDGEYIRQSLLLRKPGLWQKISLKLKSLNIHTKQNISSDETTEFSPVFVPVENVI